MPQVNKANVPVDLKLTVAGISGTNVTCQIWGQFANGTQETGTGSVDVETGSGNLTTYIVAANLNASDPIYTGSWNYTGAIVNETLTRNYLGSDVEVNHMNLTQSIGYLGLSLNMSVNMLWFRDSGVLAETVLNITTVQSGVETWEYEHITVTGAVPEFPVNMILPLLVALSTLVAVIARKRLFKNPMQ